MTAIAGELFLTSLIGIIGSFAVVRVLIGLGEAAAPPNGNRVIANWAAPHERGLALGIAVSGSSLGAALTPPLIVWIMLTWGWRAAFYIGGRGRDWDCVPVVHAGPRPARRSPLGE